MLSEILLLISAIPVGFLLAYLARDELVAGRKWFKTVIIFFGLVGGWFYLIGQLYITWTSAFVIVVTYVSLHKSYDKKWTLH